MCDADKDRILLTRRLVPHLCRSSVSEVFATVSAAAAWVDRTVGKMATVGAGEIEFVVKNPSRPAQEDIRICVPASGTVRDLKLRLQAGYPGNPEPATITVRRKEQWEVFRTG